MPTTEVTVTVWVCNFCGRGQTKTGSSLEGAQHFVDVLGWLLLGPDTVACDRCKNLPDVTHARLQLAHVHPL